MSALFPPALIAQDTAAAQASAPDVLVLMDPLQGNTEAFGQLIADAARGRLENLGFKTRLDYVPDGQDAQPDSRAGEAGAAAVIVCSYGVDSGRIAVKLAWYDPGSRTAVAESQGTGSVDLSMDSVIYAALDGLLAKVHDKVQAILAGRAARPAPVEAAAAAPLVTQPGTAPGPPAFDSRRRLLISGGFAPFVPVGAAASYFGVGYLPQILVSLVFPTRAGQIAIGLHAGMDYFSAVGLIDTSSTFLIPMGVDFRYELDLGAFRPLFHAAAGAALVVMVTGSQGTAVNAVLFIKGGIGVEYRFAPWLGLSVVADYDTYFEMPYLITGFSPSVNLAVRL